MEETKRTTISPWTALIFGISGIIVAAIIVGGIIATKAIDKIDNEDKLMDILCRNIDDLRTEPRCQE